MTTAGRARYAGYRFSAEIISHAVWLDIARAEVLAGQALAASSSNSLAHFATGQVLRAQRRYAGYSRIPNRDRAKSQLRRRILRSRAEQALCRVDRRDDPA